MFKLEKFSKYLEIVRDVQRLVELFFSQQKGMLTSKDDSPIAYSSAYSCIPI